MKWKTSVTSYFKSRHQPRVRKHSVGDSCHQVTTEACQAEAQSLLGTSVFCNALTPSPSQLLSARGDLSP